MSVLREEQTAPAMSVLREEQTAPAMSVLREEQTAPAMSVPTGRIASRGWSLWWPESPGLCCARWFRCCR
jgi:hypothetical protein